VKTDGKYWERTQFAFSSTLQRISEVRDTPPDYTQTEKKRKETRTRGKKRKEKSRIIYMLRIYFSFSPLRNLFWKFCDRGEKTDRPSWHLVWRCRLCFIYFVTSSTDGLDRRPTGSHNYIIVEWFLKSNESRRRGVFSALSRRQWFICLFAFVWPLTTTAGKKKNKKFSLSPLINLL
jgi:hypothetical protein